MIAILPMSPHHRLPLPVCIFYVEIAPSVLALILMLLSVRSLQSADLLHTSDIAKGAQTALSGTCASALTIAAAPGVDRSIVPCPMLTAPVK